MREWNFTLVIEGDLESEEVAARLFDVGCDDATFGVVDGVGFGEFDRQANTLLDAIVSAAMDVARAGLRVLHIEPDDFVTQADIAERIGKSREYVRLLVLGERGPGRFPAPVAHVRDRGRLWSWADVATWLGGTSEEELDQLRAVAALNSILQSRRHIGAVQEDGLRELLQHLDHNQDFVSA